MGTLLESSLAENDLGVLVDTTLNISQQCAHAARKADGVLGCNMMSVASRLRKVILPHYLALVKLESWVLFRASMYKTDVSVVERVQPR